MPRRQMVSSNEALKLVSDAAGSQDKAMKLLYEILARGEIIAQGKRRISALDRLNGPTGRSAFADIPSIFWKVFEMESRSWYTGSFTNDQPDMRSYDKVRLPLSRVSRLTRDVAATRRAKAKKRSKQSATLQHAALAAPANERGKRETARGVEMRAEFVAQVYYAKIDENDTVDQAYAKVFQAIQSRGIKPMAQSSVTGFISRSLALIRSGKRSRG